MQSRLSVIDVLQVYPEVLALEQRNCGLQFVLALALHAHLLALDLRLDLELPVLDDPGDLLRLLAREPVLDLRDLPDRPAQRRLHRAERERFHRHAALDELGLHDVHHALELVLVVRHDHQLALLLLERQLRPGPLEVEPLADLLHRLIEGVLDFLHVHFRGHIKRIRVSHKSSDPRPFAALRVTRVCANSTDPRESRCRPRQTAPRWSYRVASGSHTHTTWPASPSGSRPPASPRCRSGRHPDRTRPPPQLGPNQHW